MLEAEFAGDWKAHRIPIKLAGTTAGQALWRSGGVKPRLRGIRWLVGTRKKRCIQGSTSRLKTTMTPARSDKDHSTARRGPPTLDTRRQTGTETNLSQLGIPCLEMPRNLTIPFTLTSPTGSRLRQLEQKNGELRLANKILRHANANFPQAGPTAAAGHEGVHR